MASAKQKAQQARFKRAAKKCKGRGGRGAYRACMKRELRK